MENEIIQTFDLSIDHSLKGFLMEQAAKVFLRRLHKNNFIFVVSQFTDLDEIVNKYRLSLSPNLKIILGDKIHTDIIEFVLDNFQERNVICVKLYEVKAEKEPFSITPTTKEYITRTVSKLISCDIIQVTLREMKIIFILKPLNQCQLHTRSRYFG